MSLPSAESSDLLDTQQWIRKSIVPLITRLRRSATLVPLHNAQWVSIPVCVCTPAPPASAPAPAPASAPDSAHAPPSINFGAVSDNLWNLSDLGRVRVDANDLDKWLRDAQARGTAEGCQCELPSTVQALSTLLPSLFATLRYLLLVANNKELEERVHRQEQQLERNQVELEAARRKVAEQAARIVALESDREEMAERVQDAEHMLAVRTDTVKAQGEEIDSLLSQLTDVHNNFRKAEASCTAVIRRAEQLTRRNSTLEWEAEELRTELATNDTHREIVKLRTDAVLAEEHNRHKFAVLEERINSLTLSHAWVAENGNGRTSRTSARSSRHRPSQDFTTDASDAESTVSQQIPHLSRHRLDSPLFAESSSTAAERRENETPFTDMPLPLSKRGSRRIHNRVLSVQVVQPPAEHEAYSRRSASAVGHY